MTEGEWRASISPISPLHWLFFETPASDRKLRLFSVACCRRHAHLVPAASLKNLLDLAEDFAEGRTGETELRAAHREERQKYPAGASTPAVISAYLHAANDVVHDRRRHKREQIPPDCVQVVWWLLDVVARGAHAAVFTERRKEIAVLGRILHDVFGPLPFRDIAVGPWLTSDVRALVERIDESQDFSVMPILADALQDAGCEDADILSHCRDERAGHVRGCWVVDLLLGKPWRDAPT